MFRQSNQGQGQLPMFLEDVIPQGHLVRVVDEGVDRLQLSELLDKIQEREPNDPLRAQRGPLKIQATGRPAYHPRTLLKLLFYGYATGTFSSRKLAQKARDDIPTLWLTAQRSRISGPSATFARPISRRSRTCLCSSWSYARPLG